MHIIKLNDKEFNAPAKWDELTTAGLLQIAKFTQPNAHIHMAGYYLAMTLFSIPVRTFLKLQKWQMDMMLPLIKWVFAKPSVHSWLIRSVKVRSSVWLGPAHKLSDLTAEEFMYAEAAYERYLDATDTGSDKAAGYLSVLFATLYRPRHWFTGGRIRFKAKDLDLREKQSAGVLDYVKIAVAINYAGCRNLIINRHPDIWKHADGDDQLSPKEGGGLKITNWTSLILDLSGDKFGTYEQTLKTNIWLVLADMNKKAKHFAELEARNKR